MELTPKQKYHQTIAETVIKNLEKRQMKGYYCPDKESAVQLALELMPKGSSVAWGGSMTLVETGLLEKIRTEDYQVLDRESASTIEQQKEVYSKIAVCDTFLMSTNAITVGGELVNIDGRGSRVAFLCFGPEQVIILTGMNKLVQDVESGWKRVKVSAAPPNTTRLGRETPCAVTGKCHDCHAPGCICSQTVITRHSTIPGRIKVILIGEELGY